MKPIHFNFGLMFVDDDPAIIDQHQLLLDNRSFRRQSPGRIYQMLRDQSIIAPYSLVDEMLNDCEWPIKEDLANILLINSKLVDPDDPYTIVIPDIAYNAEEAKNIWAKNKNQYEKTGVYIALLDHDMPKQNGMELAQDFRSLKKQGQMIPEIIFYTGKAALLEEALTSEGYISQLENISNTGLARAVLQKGASNDEFNNLIWKAIENRISETKENYK